MRVFRYVKSFFDRMHIRWQWVFEVPFLFWLCDPVRINPIRNYPVRCTVHSDICGHTGWNGNLPIRVDIISCGPDIFWFESCYFRLLVEFFICYPCIWVSKHHLFDILFIQITADFYNIAVFAIDRAIVVKVNLFQLCNIRSIHISFFWNIIKCRVNLDIIRAVVDISDGYEAHPGCIARF